MSDDQDLMISTAYFAPMFPRAKRLWDDLLARLAAGGGGERTDLLRRAKAARLRMAFGEDNFVITCIAEYLSAMEAGAVHADQVVEVNKAAERAREAAETLADDLKRLMAALGYQATNELGSEAYGAIWTAASVADEAVRSLGLVAEQLGHARDWMPAARGRGGLASALHASPGATLAARLVEYWLWHGLRVDGGEAGDGLDDVLAFVIEATDDRRPPGKSRAKWLYEDLMAKVVRPTAEAVSSKINPPK